jgi:hypothetical protein
MGRQAGDGNQLVRLQVFFAIAILELDFGESRPGYASKVKRS